MMLNFKFSLPALACLLAVSVVYGMNPDDNDHNTRTQKMLPSVPLTQEEKRQMLEFRQQTMEALEQKYGPSAGASPTNHGNSAPQNQDSAIIKMLEKAMPWLSDEQIRQRFNSFGGNSGSPSSPPPTANPSNTPLAATADSARPAFKSYAEELAWKARQAATAGQKDQDLRNKINASLQPQ